MKIKIILPILLLSLVSCKSNTEKEIKLNFILNDNQTGYILTNGDYENLKICDIPSEYNGLQVVGIDSRAFSFCDNLTEVKIPKTVMNIGYHAFYSCDKLENIEVSNQNEYYKSIDGNLYSIDSKTLVQYSIGKKEKSFLIPDEVINIESGAFAWCDSLENVYLPLGITVIEEGLFSYCSNLISVAIPEGVTSILEDAFYYCDKLTNVVIPKTLINIEDAAFACCDSLLDIYIRKNVEKIGVGAFRACESLIAIEVESDNKKYKSIDGNLYSKDGYTLIQYASGKIDTKFIVPEGVTSIEEYALSSNNLKTIEIPSTYENYNENSFYYCYSLENINVNANNLLFKSVNGNLYSKDGTKFLKYPCGKDEKEFVIPEGVSEIYKEAFYSSDLEKIKLPSTLIILGEDVVLFCRNLKHIDVNINNPLYKSIDGNLYSKDGTIYILYAPGKEEKKITIPEGVTVISDKLFYFNSLIEKVSFPYTLEKIGEKSFAYCSSLSSLVIPEGVTVIEEGAFSDCTNLKSVSLSKRLKNIGSFAFKNCENLIEINLPESITRIESYLFCDCHSLQSISIPIGVTYIGNCAFADCYSLKSIVIPKNVDEMGSEVFYGCYDLIINCEVSSKPEGWHENWNPHKATVYWREN